VGIGLRLFHYFQSAGKNVKEKRNNSRYALRETADDFGGAREKKFMYSYKIKTKKGEVDYTRDVSGKRGRRNGGVWVERGAAPCI